MKTLLFVLLLVLVVFTTDTKDKNAEKHGGLFDAVFSHGEKEEKSEGWYDNFKRTVCLFLARNHANTQKTMIERFLANYEPKQQEGFIDKIYATAVQECEGSLTKEDMKKLSGDKPFDVKEFFGVFKRIDYPALLKGDFKLTDKQKTIMDYIRQVDTDVSNAWHDKLAQIKKIMPSIPSMPSMSEMGEKVSDKVSDVAQGIKNKMPDMPNMPTMEQVTHKVSDIASDIKDDIRTYLLRVGLQFFGVSIREWLSPPRMFYWMVLLGVLGGLVYLYSAGKRLDKRQHAAQQQPMEKKKQQGKNLESGQPATNVSASAPLHEKAA